MLKLLFTKQFLGFLAAGALAAFLHWLARLVLSEWFSFPVAVAVAYAVGMSVAFTLNSIFVFPHSVKPRRKQARDFVIVNALFFPVVWGASVSMDHLFRKVGVGVYSEAAAHAIAVALPTFLTFFIYKFFAFKDA
ncbi:GtrA family protein [Bordetella genomosp. 11]|uniref:GtrA family protein n=1 Tax=Bordetella genomosp. 11 TaxID=1416808 RepID=UPI001595E4CF|nr:GtrA family protein [Bordetella genomosp. 11]